MNTTAPQNAGIVFSNHWNFFRRFFQSLESAVTALFLFSLLTIPARAATPDATTPCWTNIHGEAYFPDDDPVFLGERVLLLPRGTYEFDVFLPTDYDRHPSQRYPLAVIAAPLEPDEQHALAEFFCARGWLMLAPALPSSPSEEKVLGALICSYVKVTKKYRVLPGTQLLAGYGTGAEIGAWFAATRRPFAAWIGDNGLFPREAEGADAPWLTKPLNNHPDLLLYAIQRETNQPLTESFQRSLPESAPCRFEMTTATNRPLPPEAMACALDWVREQILFELPPDGRHFDYAQMEYDRLLARLPQATGPEREQLLQQLTALKARFFLNVPELTPATGADELRAPAGP